jgi:hypothetical protein
MRTMVLVYAHLQNWVIFRVNVGEYSSTMEHMVQPGFFLVEGKCKLGGNSRISLKPPVEDLKRTMKFFFCNLKSLLRKMAGTYGGWFCVVGT